MNKDYTIILDLMQLAREQRYILSNSVKKLTPSGSAILISLSEKDGVSATDIATSMGYEKPFVTHVVKGLVSEEYVSVSRIDGRTVRISLTDKGKTAATEMKNNLIKFVDLLFQDFSEEERNTVKRNIRKLKSIRTDLFDPSLDRD